jgi:dihydroorotase-like cyclic amidohydrolase
MPAVYVALAATVALFLQCATVAVCDDEHAATLSFPSPPFVLRSSHVLLYHGRVVPAEIFIDVNGSIETVHERRDGGGAANAAHDDEDRLSHGRPVLDVTPLLIMPGLIDPHVHVNSPGRTAWEGFASATRAAAAGGTTALLDMPLNNIPSKVWSSRHVLWPKSG